nr:hypothetical protein [Tanacetum cinerariifolium]
MPGVTRAMAMLTNVVQQFYRRPINDYLRTSSNTRLRLVEKPQPRATLRTQMNIRTSVNVKSIRNFRNNDIDGVNNARARYVGNNGKGIKTIGPKCFNCKEIGHIARNNTSTLKKKSSEFYKEAMLLAQKDDSGIDLNEDKYDFILFFSKGKIEKLELETLRIFMEIISEIELDTDEPETKLHPDLAQTTWIDDVQPDKETRNTEFSVRYNSMMLGQHCLISSLCFNDDK